MTRVPWEKKVEVWRRLVKGDALSKIPVFASVSHYTVGQLKKEWESLSVEKLAQLPEDLLINHPKYSEFLQLARRHLDPNPEVALAG